MVALDVESTMLSGRSEVNAPPIESKNWGSLQTHLYHFDQHSAKISSNAAGIMEPESDDIQGANNMNILYPWIEKAHDRFLPQSLQCQSMRLELLLTPPIYSGQTT